MGRKTTRDNVRKPLIRRRGRIPRGRKTTHTGRKTTWLRLCMAKALRELFTGASGCDSNTTLCLYRLRSCCSRRGRCVSELAPIGDMNFPLPGPKDTAVHAVDAAGDDTWNATGICQPDERKGGCRVGGGSTWSSGVGWAGYPEPMDASSRGEISDAAVKLSC